MKRGELLNAGDGVFPSPALFLWQGCVWRNSNAQVSDVLLYDAEGVSPRQNDFDPEYLCSAKFFPGDSRKSVFF
jgi:hypothetical protein